MNSWEKTNEELAYDGYRKVVRRTFTLPGGKSSDFDVVKGGGSVAVLALTPDNQIVCFKQFRPGPEKVLNELPGGAIEPEDLNEAHSNIETAAVLAGGREFLEETGYTAELEYIGKYYRDAYNSGVWHMVVGRNAKLNQEIQPDPSEPGEISLLTVSEFKKELFAGDMTDTTLGYAGLNHFGLLSND